MLYFVGRAMGNPIFCIREEEKIWDHEDVVEHVHHIDWDFNRVYRGQFKLETLSVITITSHIEKYRVGVQRVKIHGLAQGHIARYFLSDEQYE